jgi:hypothetical protein
MMTSKARVTALGGAVALMSVSGLLHAGTDQPSRHALTSAVNRYLSDHGDLCVGKFTWPRVVTPEDRLAKTNDAVQLPVLERLSLVESTEISAPAATPPASSTPAAAGAAANAVARGSQSGAAAESGRRYSLTEKGRRYYLQKKRITLGAHDRPVEHDEDLCVARLSLDKVVKWSPPEQVHGHLETVVRYTYHIKPADWMSDPQAREVFPVVDRIIRHEGNMLMSVNVRLQDGRWRPVLPTL